MNNYPTKKVIAGYALLGGALGGGLLFIITQMLALPVGDPLSFGDIGYIVLAGIIAGTIPAVLTGMVLAFTKTYLTSIKDGVKCFIVGFLATLACYLLPMVVIFSDVKDWGLMLKDPNFIILSVLGGVLSVVLAFLLLPKRLEKTRQ